MTKNTVKNAVILLLLLEITATSGFLLIRKSNHMKNMSVMKNALVITRSNNTKPKSTESIKILFGGDVMLDRYIRRMANNNSYDFILEELDDYLNEMDLVVVNLEGPITPHESVSIGTEIGSKNNYVFTFDEQITDTLVRKNIKLVNIGNNHILNFGGGGLISTKKALSDADIGYFGDTGTDTGLSYSVEIKGKIIGFVNYNQFIGDYGQNILKTISEIEKMGPVCDVVVVFAHWGNEYSEASQFQTQTAHKFVDAGADLVVGSHPHVVQKSEVYNDKFIYYSLGNFVMDQYFSEETTEGLLVEMTLDVEREDISYEEHKVQMLKNGQTVFSQSLH